MQVVEGEAGGAVQADGQRRRDAPALGVDLVAVDHVVAVAQQVDPQGGVFTQLVVHVDRAAIVVGAAAGNLGGGLVAHVGGLGDDVDHPSGGAPAEQGARRPLQYLHLLVVEGIPGVDAEVAQAIEVDVVLGFLAADAELVAVQRAALADGDGDARHIAQRLLEGDDLLLLQLQAGDDVGRLGCVLQCGGLCREAGAAVEASGTGGHHHPADFLGRRIGRQLHRGVARLGLNPETGRQDDRAQRLPGQGPAAVPQHPFAPPCRHSAPRTLLRMRLRVVLRAAFGQGKGFFANSSQISAWGGFGPVPGLRRPDGGGLFCAAGSSTRRSRR